VHSPQHGGAAPVSVEQRHIKPEPGGVPAQVAVFECLLPVKQQPMHVPEPVLERGGLGCGRSREGVRVDLSQRKVPESEADPPVRLCSTRSISRNA
jgi:hypothetical protein